MSKKGHNTIYFALEFHVVRLLKLKLVLRSNEIREEKSFKELTENEISKIDASYRTHYRGTLPELLSRYSLNYSNTQKVGRFVEVRLLSCCI